MTKRDLTALRIDPEARERRRPRWLVPALVLAGVVAVGLTSVAVLATGRPVVSVSRAREMTSTVRGAVLNASGYVTPRRRATVSAKITGKLVEVLVEEGLEVETGQVLARLDDLDAAASLAAAEAELAVARARVAELEVELKDARRSLRRIRKLHDDGVASDDELDRAVTRADVLVAGVDRARRQVTAAQRSVAVFQRSVDNHVVRAPFAGIVVSKDAQEGEMVSPVSAGGGFTRTGISTIVDMASLEIEVDVNEAYIARVHAEQAVEAVLDAYPDWRIPAHVITVIPTADRQKATVQVRIGFDRLDPRILPDMGVRVTFLEERAETEAAGSAIVVDQAAVRERDGRTVVFVVDGERVERRAVQLGSVRGDLVEVEAGLVAGESVIVQGPADIADGARVKVEES
jgi:RND family efflux transporter MFP subunit